MNFIDIFINFYIIPIILSFILVVIYSILLSHIYDYDFYSIIKSSAIYMIFPITNIILVIIILIKLIPLMFDFIFNSISEIWHRL